MGKADDFLRGGGEMGALMRSHDWSKSTLGEPSTWPQPLRVAVRVLLNTGHPMYIWWGKTGACLYNDAYRQSIGPERHPGSLGRPAREVWLEIWPVIGPQIEQVMSGGGATWQKDHLVPITRHGRREDVYWTYSYSPIDDGAAPNGVGGVLVICTETTERVRSSQLNATLEERVEERTRALAAMQDELRQAQKMEAIGQLTGGIAHDFNNLLAGITGSLEMLNRRIAQGRVADTERYVLAAQGAAKRAAALTHRLLAFARRQTLDARPTDVPRLIEGLEDLLRRTMGPSIRVETAHGACVWTILIDANQLENVLLNLGINARDAMPDGGVFTIDTVNRTIEAREAAELDVAAGDYVSIRVSDTGSGMPPDVVKRAFDPFFTTKPLGSGTGLGLSMTYGFARQSGGQVRIHSTPGRGTTVSMDLPRHLGEMDLADSLEKSIDVVRAEHEETVLVVDDEPTVRMLITEVLEDLGYTSIEAADGVAGLKVLQSSIRIDLLITDVGLPGGINGRQMADAARTSRADLKVLFITGYAENAVLRDGHLDTGMYVLTKPFAMDALAQRIDELLKPP